MTTVDHAPGAAVGAGPVPSPTAPRRGPLQPVELATAGVLGAMTVVLVIAGWFLPHASIVTALGCVPMGVIGYRHRARAVVAGVVASSSVGFLVAGTGVISTIFLCGLVGGVAGVAHRRGWGPGRVALVAAGLGPLLAVAADGLLWVFSSLRKLTLLQLVDTWRGLAGVLGRLAQALLGWLPGRAHVGADLTRTLDTAVRWGVQRWWQTIAVAIVVFTVSATVFAWQALAVLLAQLERVRATDRLAEVGEALAGAVPDAAVPDAVVPDAAVPEAVSPRPVPVVLEDVRVRYPGAASDALAGVSLAVGAAELVAVLGPNGSGKSTLARVLAGVPPTSGTVRRPGPVGLGALGGTAVIAQRPESQVLGVRVVDDVTWGLPRHVEVDVGGLLAAVGLAGMERRETSGLSGGELQRLAVAAALARRPGLLVSDESTAMVDADGRRQLVDLLRRLPTERGITVVHVTHRRAETVGADRAIQLRLGRVDDPAASALPGAAPAGPVAPRPARPDAHPAAATPPRVPTAAEFAAATLDAMAARPGAAAGADDPAGRRPAAAAGRGAAAGGGAATGRAVAAGRVGAPSRGPAPVVPAPLVLRLAGVGHVYADGTPWAQPALRDVDLDVRAGEGVLVVGGNGSGKSTLAWILAGLLRPTSGTCELDGTPVDGQVGSVGLAFQHARLQVQRATVGRDVRAAGGVERDRAEEALRLVGLDPSGLWDRSVDELSGGQLRRVALAGLLTRTPRVLVLDEPLAGLDEESRYGLIAVLADLRAARGLTLVVISHDLEGAGDICERAVQLTAGRVTADGSLSTALAGRT